MTRRVLIVDDSLAMRHVTRKRLTDAGFLVVGEAQDGRAAVDAFQELDPDFVLMDLVMPVMGGLDALKSILAGTPDARIVICSSIGNEHDVSACLSEGAVAYLQKPVDADDLIRTLANLGD